MPGVSEHSWLCGTDTTAAPTWLPDAPQSCARRGSGDSHRVVLSLCPISLIKKLSKVSHAIWGQKGCARIHRWSNPSVKTEPSHSPARGRVFCFSSAVSRDLGVKMYPMKCMDFCGLPPKCCCLASGSLPGKGPRPWHSLYPSLLLESPVLCSVL